jgi:poly(3-hydroxybutyrate) depolymerase
MADRRIKIGDLEMPFWYKVYGEPDADEGRALFISMHGGGGAPARVNDRQWENQKRLYSPEEGVYLAPRAPTNTWNLWHQGHIDDFFDRLIENLVVLENVDPDKVYIMGYSAGGDGVFQLAPRMADRLAAAAMMAGHPNETKPDGLRNLPFTLHMGAEDGAYSRNEKARQWKKWLADLAAADPGGYPHEVVIHEGKGHWMDREDAVAVEWMAEHRRDLRPEKIVWLQDDVTHSRFYWLAVDQPQAREKIVVERDGNTVRIEEGGDRGLRIRVDDAMFDLDRPITVYRGEDKVFEGRVPRSREVIEKTLGERGDRRGIFTGEIVVPPLEDASPKAAAAE